jgi:hypothetical protein
MYVSKSWMFISLPAVCLIHTWIFKTIEWILMRSIFLIERVIQEEGLYEVKLFSIRSIAPGESRGESLVST